MFGPAVLRAVTVGLRRPGARRSPYLNQLGSTFGDLAPSRPSEIGPSRSPRDDPPGEYVDVAQACVHNEIVSSEQLLPAQTPSLPALQRTVTPVISNPQIDTKSRERLRESGVAQRHLAASRKAAQRARLLSTPTSLLLTFVSYYTFDSYLVKNGVC